MIAASLKHFLDLASPGDSSSFRGLMIAASLKREALSVLCRAPVFPRSYDRGLIEARPENRNPPRLTPVSAVL